MTKSLQRKNNMVKIHDYICPVCNTSDIDIFIYIPQIPVYCNILYKSRNEAKDARRADMELGFCRQCGHVYNYAFNPDLMDYTQDYENSLHFSPRFQEYAESLADRLMNRYDLYGKDIIEIGCGDGDFLELLCRNGENRCYGFDPSHVPDLDKTGKEKRIQFIRDYYSEKYSNYPADLICCRHVLEHIQQPLEFLKTVRAAVGQSTDAVIFFEVPNVLYTLKDLGIWDLIYEHCSYFSPQSLRTVFESAGFTVLSETEEFQNQFLGIEAQPSSSSAGKFRASDESLDELKEYVGRFEKSYSAKVRYWQESLSRMKTRGRKAAVWGAGSKGATFLNNLSDADAIRCVVDINPRKLGNFIAGTAHPIVAPESLPEYRPDKIIVMNPIYLPEIRQTVDEIGLTSELVAV